MVARVGLVPITAPQIVAAIKEHGAAGQRRYREPAELRLLVEDQIRLELLAQAAMERGLDRDPEVVAAARKIMVRKLLERDMDSARFDGEGATISEQAIVNHYERNRDKYLQPEMRRLAHIQLAPDEKGRALAVSLIAQLEAKPGDRTLFRQLAKRYSLDPGNRERGGEVSYTTHEALTQDFGLSFANQVFALATDELASAPVQSTKGWHIVRLISVREALVRPLDEVRDDIRERLLRTERSKTFDRYLGELRTRFPVALHEEQLQALSAELAESKR